MLHKYIAHLLINNKINRIFYVGCLIVQTIQVLLLFINSQKTKFIKDALLLTFINPIALSSLFLCLQIIVGVCLVCGYFIYLRHYKDTLQEKKFSQIFLTNLINYIILLYRTVFLLPVYQNLLTSFIPQINPIHLSLSIIVLVLWIIIITPTTVLGFCNKFSIKKQSLTFPYVINLQSFVYLSLQIIIVLNTVEKVIMPYVNLIIVMVSCIIIYTNSPFSYIWCRKITFFYSLIVSEILLAFVKDILNLTVQNSAEIVMFCLYSLCIGFLMYQFQNYSIKRMFLSKVRQSKNCFDFVSNHNEMFLYHMLNFASYSNQVFIYLFEHESNCLNDQCLGKTIFTKLRQNETQEALFSLIRQFFIDQIESEYHPSHLEGLGEKEIQKALHEKGRLYLLISQLMLIGNQECTVKENLRKTYCLIKSHEELTKKSKTEDTFMARVEIAVMLQIIEEELVLTVKREALTDKFSVKAQEYFEFQEKMETFKTHINKACDANIEFWRELMYKEPDQLKVKKLISKAQHYASKVETLFSRLTTQYKRASIVIYELMAQYSEMVLNCELTSVLNPFHSLHAKFKEEMAEYQKERHDTVSTSFSVTAKTPVCMISLEKNDCGSLCWENTAFREEYHLSHQVKSHINDLMLPFFREKHMQFLTEFSLEDTLRYDHGETFFYRETDDGIKWFEVSQLQAQILPSVKMGLKMLIHFKDHHHSRKEPKRMILIDEHSEHCILSKDLYEEWESNIVSVGTEDDFMISLQNKFQKSQQQSQINVREKEGIEIKLDMDDSDYKAKLIKIIRDSKETKFYCFQVFNMLALPCTSKRQNTFTESLKKNPETQNCVKAFMSNTVQSLNQTRKVSVKQGNYQQHGDFDNQLYMSADVKRVTDIKSDIELNIQKSYLTISTSKTPKKVRLWKFVTGFLIILIVAAALTNIVITIYRQELYDQDINIIVKYNQLAQYIVRTLITLKQYNYEAFKNTSSPKLPTFLHQINSYQTVISNNLHQLASQLTGSWMIFQFEDNGHMSMHKQIQFVVIANYILSSITFISEQPSEELNFNFLQSKFPWYLGMKKTQTSFQNAVYNSKYVCLQGMLEKRGNLTQSVKHQILEIHQQKYIYPTIVGVICLLLFIVFSVIIELKSTKLIQDTVRVLQSVSQDDRKQRIKYLEAFKEEIFANQIHHKPQKTMPIVNQSRFFETAQIKSSTIQGMTTQIIENNITSSRTDRQLNNVTENSVIKPFNNLKFEQNPSQLQSKGQQNGLNFETNKKKTFLFYFGLVVPFMTYFISIFIGGLYLNEKIMFYIKFGSQLYHLNTYQQYVYFLARQTFIYESGLPSWGQLILPAILDIYTSSHYIEDHFQEMEQKSSFGQMKNRLDTSNLCQYLDLLPEKSIYYGIDFSKSQCLQVGNHILTKGFKSSFIYFVQTGVELLDRNMNPQNMPLEQRINYLEGLQLWHMKQVLAYSEQFLKILAIAFHQTINQSINSYTRIVNIASIVIIFTLIFAIKALNYRWLKIKSQSKEVQSLLKIISLKTIKNKKSVCDQFLALDYKFYE